MIKFSMIVGVLSLSLSLTMIVKAQEQRAGEAALYINAIGTHPIETSGIFERLGYGQRRGTLVLMNRSGQMKEYALANDSKLLVNGKRFLCVDYPEIRDGDCKQWPLTIVPGKTTVYAKYVSTQFGGRTLNVVTEISIHP